MIYHKIFRGEGCRGGLYPQNSAESTLIPLNLPINLKKPYFSFFPLLYVPLKKSPYVIISYDEQLIVTFSTPLTKRHVFLAITLQLLSII